MERVSFVAGLLTGLLLGVPIGMGLLIAYGIARLTIGAETEGWDLEGPPGWWMI